MSDLAFPASRTAALEKLQAFVPKAGRDYAAKRNYDLPGHPHVSGLSPYIRHRVLTETEVLEATLNRHSPQAAEKFIQEVFWRTYWKGWLEMRPGVWGQYKADLNQAINNLQTQSGLRAEWEAACKGETGIEPFDHWAKELVQTGYLHNHARMWFASIWIFTLRLPWSLGADFFLRHLLDGDPAANTLSWRWVGGLQTMGKTYLARTSNISKFTEGRFHPKWQLAGEASPLKGPEPPARQPLKPSGHPARATNPVLLLTEEDLSPGFLFQAGLKPKASALLLSTRRRSPLNVVPQVIEFTENIAKEALKRYASSLGENAGFLEDADAVLAWAETHGADAIVTPQAPVGPAADQLNSLRSKVLEHGIDLIEVRRDFDEQAWPHATHGFFRFKEHIPSLLTSLNITS
ncbi:MAG: FAD-binding domain-containing protein [Pseudomonadota bacterium]